MPRHDAIQARLLTLYRQGPVERGILDILSGRKKNRRQTTVTTFQNELPKHGVRVPRQRVVKATKALAATGVGRYRKGVHGYETRIEWIVPVTEVGRLIAHGLGADKADEAPETTAVELRAQRDALLHCPADGNRIARSLLQGLDDQERLLVGEREADLYVVDSCLDPAGAHRALLAVEDLATALSAADVVGEVYVGDVLAFPELVRQACHEAAPPVVARLAAALKGLVYASATPPALRLVRAAGGDGNGGDPNGE